MSCATALVGASPMTLRARCLVGFADRGERVAFAGAGLAVDDRQPFGAGRVPKRARLLAGDPVEFLAAEDLTARCLSSI